MQQHQKVNHFPGITILIKEWQFYQERIFWEKISCYLDINFRHNMISSQPLGIYLHSFHNYTNIQFRSFMCVLSHLNRCSFYCRKEKFLQDNLSWKIKSGKSSLARFVHTSDVIRVFSFSDSSSRVSWINNP